MIAADDSEVELENGHDLHQRSKFNEEQQESTISLQSFFTLPFALHIRPLPHVSFLAQEESADSSDADQNRRSSSSSSNTSNYKAGRHRLNPAVQSVSPHPLSTISVLLERTGCLEAVPQWTHLLTLLEKADDDAHFTKLRQFFDARFDGDGNIVSDKTKNVLSEDEKEVSPIWGSSGIFGRRANSTARRRSRTRSGASQVLAREDSSTRRGSNASKASSRPAVIRNKSQLGKSVTAEDQNALSKHDEGASSIGEDIRSHYNSMSPSGLDRGFSQRQKLQSQSIQESVLTAPEINFTPRGSTLDGIKNESRQRSVSSRPVRFRIRLDLHSVHLAPRPPRGSSVSASPNINLPMRSGSQRAYTKQQLARMASSPEKYTDLHRVISLGATSSSPSLADGVSLHQVVSPGSAQSQPLSDESHSDRQAGDDLSVSPRRRGGRQGQKSNKDQSAGRTFTGSSAATNLTSLFGSSPESREEKRSSGSPTKQINDDGRRRPSMIQRLINFNGRKHSSSSRKHSMTTHTNQSNASADEENGHSEGSASVMKGRTLPVLKTMPLNMQDNSIIMSSPINLEPPPSRSFSMAMNSQDALDVSVRGKASEGSDWSNEEEDALSIADDEGSIGSSIGWGKGSSSRRKSSSGVLPSNAAALLPVHEGRVFDSSSAFAGNHHDGQGIEEENEDEAEWEAKDDFLSLLRSAAQTTLTLKNFKGKFSAEGNLTTPKSSSSTPGDLRSPPESFQEEQQFHAEELLAHFNKRGNEENPDSWWLCGKADPLPISFACALSQAMGWEGIMKLCYGKESKCSKSGTFSSLSKAAEMHGKLQEDSEKVRSWAQAVSQNREDSAPLDDTIDIKDEGEVEADAEDDVAPSESASANRSAEAKASKLSRWMNKIPGRNFMTEDTTEAATLSNAVPSLTINDQAKLSTLEERTWQDWADLFASIASWVEEYESTRVRSGMAREVDREPSRKKDTANREDVEDGMTYISIASSQIPRCVIQDALEADNGFRRRHGIPEGLPVGVDGEEVGDYRWARRKLTSSHFATALILATGSLSYFYGQLAASDWTYNSSWELDYLEMCVFHSDIISTRFPSPCTSIVPFDQVYQPAKNDKEAIKRAKTCPYPQNGAWDYNQWHRWLTTVQSGMILVPAVSWQAWWTLIAVLNGADGSGRAFDLQVKAAEEPFSALDDMKCFYI